MLFGRQTYAGPNSQILTFIQFGDNIQTARQLRNAVFAEFFDKS